MLEGGGGEGIWGPKVVIQTRAGGGPDGRGMGLWMHVEGRGSGVTLQVGVKGRGARMMAVWLMGCCSSLLGAPESGAFTLG